MNDRRSTGVTRTVASDGNGSKYHVISYSWGITQTILAGMIALATIVGAVWAAARTGIRVEVKDVIESECNNPAGVIHRQMHEIAKETTSETEAALKRDMGEVKAQLQKSDDDLKDMKEVATRLDERQQALITKVDAQHREVIEELRLMRNGNH